MTCGGYIRWDAKSPPPQVCAPFAVSVCVASDVRRADERRGTGGMSSVEGTLIVAFCDSSQAEDSSWPTGGS